MPLGIFKDLNFELRVYFIVIVAFGTLIILNVFAYTKLSVRP